MLSHTLFINKNNKIINVITEIMKVMGLDNIIFYNLYPHFLKYFLYLQYYLVKISLLNIYLIGIQIY